MPPPVGAAAVPGELPRASAAMLRSGRAAPLIVRCASCQTEFALDDRQVGPEGAAVRCSHCGHVFRAAAPDGVLPQPWQVRTIDDLLFTAPDLATLHAWVLEGRLHPDDCVSRSGRNFVRLSEMPEFAEAFSGFVGLPGVLETQAERGPSERSAFDILGPPPAFGTHAGDESSSALAGVPEAARSEHSSALEQVLGHAASASSSSYGVDSAESAAVSRVHDHGGAWPVAQTGAPGSGGRGQTPVPSREVPPGTRARLVTPPPIATRIDAPAPGRGIPQPVGEDRSSRPLSMLDVVTHHVRPITTSAIELPRHAESVRVGMGRGAAREVLPEVAAADPSPVPTSSGARRSGWPVWAVLGVLAGGAVVFGIPQIRARVLGSTAAPVAPIDDAPVLAAAAAAIASADPQALARAEAALQATMDARGSEARTSADLGPLRATAAEVLATRAVVHELWAAVEPAMGSDARFWAQEDAGRAAALLEAMDPAAAGSSAAFARAEALLRVLHGRADITGLGADQELPLVVAVAPLLRDPHAQLSASVRAGLAALGRPSVLARLILALGHARAGEAAAALAVLDGVLVEFPGQPVARALRRSVVAPAKTTPALAPAGGDEPVVVADTGEPPSVIGTPEPTVVDPTTAVPAGESADRLIDRGCKKAEGSDAPGALVLLRKALEKRPGDLDALLCLGDANSRLGAYDAALKHYERALAKSPQMMSALQGAAKAAAKLGRTATAVKLYERLLEQDPSHVQARAYLDGHKADAPGGDNG